jgi:flagellar basal body rod protein FlgC
MEWKLFKEENEGKWFCTCPKCVEKGKCSETLIEIKKHHKWKGIPKYKRGHYTSVYTQDRDIKRDKSNGWKGGRYIDKDGYVLVYMPEHPSARKDGYILEHRLIMEQRIGRLLTKKEVVHHRGKKNDNENTKLFSSNGDHLKVELSALRDKGEPYKRKDFLIKEYIKKNRSLADIGDQFGVTVQAVFRFVRKFGIKKTKAKVDAARASYIRKSHDNKHLVAL